MNLEQLAKALIDYRKYCSMTNPVRFAATTLHQAPLPELYGMDPRMFTLSPAQRAESIVEKSEATDILVKLLRGEEVNSQRMSATLGISYDQLMNYLAELNPIKKPIPDGLVILTFDDAKKDHYTHVAPLLRELGFSATFCVTEMEPSARNGGFEDKDVFMTWEEIRSLHEMGFDVGNHSLHHRRPSDPLDREDFSNELLGLNEHMRAAGIPDAVSVAYPFGMSTSDQVSVADQCGMLWGRGNVNEGICGCNGKSVYNPLCDNPLAIPSYGDAPLYTYERLLDRLSSTVDGTILCLAYHSVTDPEEWTNTITFEQHFRFIADHGYHGISMAQLGEYIDAEKAKKLASL